MAFGIDDAIVGAGAAIGGIASYFGQRDANAANARMARENMAWQERMSNTSWQRGIADMKAAGINPMLAFSKGGASQPSSTPATAQNVHSNSPATVNNALQATLLRTQLAKLESEVALNDAMKLQAGANANLMAHTAHSVDANTYNTTQMGKFNEWRNKINTGWFGTANAYAQMFLDTANQSTDLASKFMPMNIAGTTAKQFSHTPKGTIYNHRTGDIHYKGEYR